MAKITLILGLDISSKAIGWCVRNSAVVAYGTIELPKDDISERCLAAKDEIGLLVDRYSPDAVAIESPVARYANSVIAQCCIRGVALLVIAEYGMAWCDVAPKEAKAILAEDGAATKREMLQAAAPHFGYDPQALDYRCKREKWSAWVGDVLVFGEDAADALAVAMHAAGRVEVVG